MHHILLTAAGSDGYGRKIPETAEHGYIGHQAQFFRGLGGYLTYFFRGGLDRWEFMYVIP